MPRRIADSISPEYLAKHLPPQPPAAPPRPGQTREATMPPPLERDVQAAIVDALRAQGWTVWELLKGSQGNGAVYCTKGLPDLYVFRPGIPAVWLECKRPQLGRLSQAQVERHAELRDAGQIVVVVTSVDDALGVLARLPRVP